MFDLTRRMLTQKEVRDLLGDACKTAMAVPAEAQKEFGLPEKLKEVPESRFMKFLQNNPGKWDVLEEYLQVLAAQGRADDTVQKAWRKKMVDFFKAQICHESLVNVSDPLDPMVLSTPDGSPGYKEPKIYTNHPALLDGKTLPPADLKKALIDFINGARRELMFNVFDFDLMDVAQAMLDRAKAGVKITGGIDKGVIESRPEVKAVYEALNQHPNIKVHAVDSVGLNHQKIVVRDFNDPKLARALFSSGNFTQSCIGPEGDLVKEARRPADSVPNANHMMELESYYLAQTAAHSLIKTMVYQLRGDQYPLGGAFKVFGAKNKAAKENPYMVVAFSPKGGLGDINRDITARLIKNSRGPLRFLQFAFSSNKVEEAIVERARLEKAEGNSFDLKTVGDTPFAVRPWSVTLKLSGYNLNEDKDKGIKEYVEPSANRLKEILGDQEYQKIRENVRTAPQAYKEHHFVNDKGEKLKYGAKLHHKVVISGPYAVLGTSFNFSEGANTNQEQFIYTNDPSLVKSMHGVFDGFFNMGTSSVQKEVLRRQELLKRGEKVGDDEKNPYDDRIEKNSDKK